MSDETTTTPTKVEPTAETLAEALPFVNDRGIAKLMEYVDTMTESAVQFRAHGGGSDAELEEAARQSFLADNPKLADAINKIEATIQAAKAKLAEYNDSFAEELKARVEKAKESSESRRYADQFAEARKAFRAMVTAVQGDPKEFALPRIRSSVSKNTDTERLQRIREWARENGHDVADRGRIAQDVVDAYDKANA